MAVIRKSRQKDFGISTLRRKEGDKFWVYFYFQNSSSLNGYIPTLMNYFLLALFFRTQRWRKFGHSFKSARPQHWLNKHSQLMIYALHAIFLPTIHLYTWDSHYTYHIIILICLVNVCCVFFTHIKLHLQSFCKITFTNRRTSCSSMTHSVRVRLYI